MCLLSKRKYSMVDALQTTCAGSIHQPEGSHCLVDLRNACKNDEGVFVSMPSILEGICHTAIAF